ncbi:MAG: hypothetical protein FJ271_33480 [Planctomycetes bacterium]|nr:hypothetical protein [Planctomycetota bacterium]
MKQQSLFDLVNPASAPNGASCVLGMIRQSDHHTAVDAAAVIEPKRTELHQRVLDAFVRHGNMTDEQLEQLPEFNSFGPSTIRKRRSELYQQKALFPVSEAVNSRGRKMWVWGLL